MDRRAGTTTLGIVDYILELATEFRSEKIPRNRLRTYYDIPRKKVLIPKGIPSTAEEPIPRLGMERNEFRGKIRFTEQTKVVCSGPIFEICGCRVLL